MLYDFPEGEASPPGQMPLMQLAALGVLAWEYCVSVRTRERGQMTCPSCDDNNLHLAGTCIHHGETLTVLAGDRTHVVCGIHTHLDGDAIVIVLFCENCQRFIVERIREQKGHCYRSAVTFAADDLATIAEEFGSFA